jgi:hypothetical protein
MPAASTLTPPLAPSKSRAHPETARAVAISQRTVGFSSRRPVGDHRGAASVKTCAYLQNML